MIHSRYFVLPALALLGLGLSACAPADTKAATPDPFPSFEHIHAVEMDPDRGELYIASHSGLWRVTPEQVPAGFPVAAGSAAPERTSPTVWDVMGFAVTDSGLVASGHPAPGERSELELPNLGLLWSADAGATWEERSLTGTVDFHALETGPGERLIGYDSGGMRILRSEDSGKTWEPGAGGQAYALAVDPLTPDTLWITTQTGLMKSTDAGTTMESVDIGAPPVGLIDSVPAGPLLAATGEGELWRLDTGTPRKTGALGTEAESLSLTRAGDTVWTLAADERGIVASADLGATWTVLLARR